MPKKAVSLTLEQNNLVWLQGLSTRAGARSLSETVDRIITAARECGDVGAAAARSVLGTVDISDADPELEGADAAIRQQFDRSLKRPFFVRKATTSRPAKRAKRG